MKKVEAEVVEEELEPDKVDDLEEIESFLGLKKILNANGNGEDQVGDDVEDEIGDKDFGEAKGLLDRDDVSPVFDSNDSSFDLDLDSFGNTKVRIAEPKFRMTLAELLDESKVVPISVYGNLEVEISWMQHDSRLVSSEDLFACCVGRDTDRHLLLSEADKRGAMERKNVDVHPLKYELSLFETQVLVNSPHGILEILSVSLRRHYIYNILAAMAVGIAVGASLEDIVRGIEEIDAVLGRFELIDEEQAFGVIFDHALVPLLPFLDFSIP